MENNFGLAGNMKHETIALNQSSFDGNTQRDAHQLFADNTHHSTTK